MNPFNPKTWDKEFSLSAGHILLSIAMIDVGNMIAKIVDIDTTTVWVSLPSLAAMLVLLLLYAWFALNAVYHFFLWVLPEKRNTPSEGGE